MTDRRDKTIKCERCQVPSMVIVNDENYIQDVICPGCGREAKGIEALGWFLNSPSKTGDQKPEDIASESAVKFRESSDSVRFPLKPSMKFPEGFIIEDDD